jgi:hypothetical protein
MLSEYAHASHAKVAARLKRAEGHLRSVIAMMDSGKPCVDVAHRTYRQLFLYRGRGVVRHRDHHGSAGGFSGVSTRVPPTSDSACNATPCPGDPIPGGNCEISASADPPAAGEAGRYSLSFLLEPGDPNVVNNHIAVDAVIGGPELDFAALSEEATRGTPLPFRILARDVKFGRIDMEDVSPEGFTYARGSARVNGRAQEPQIEGRRLRFPGLAPDSNGEIEITLAIVAAGGIGDGRHFSTPLLRHPGNGTVLARAEAAVTLIPERVFDCTDELVDGFTGTDRRDALARLRAASGTPDIGDGSALTHPGGRDGRLFARIARNDSHLTFGGSRPSPP